MLRSHCIRARESERSRRIWSSSCRLYRPRARHSRRMLASMILVNASANCACDGTHLICIPFLKCSLMSLACNWVLNSWQLGGACLLMRSKSDLQSVVIMAWVFSGNFESACCRVIGGFVSLESSSGGIAANAGGNLTKVSSACCHWHWPSRIHAQYNRIHDSTSTAPASDIASAESVLTTTFWIFLECHTSGLTGQFLFSAIDLWVDIIIIPWCESGFLAEANEASENATNRMSLMDIGWNLMVTSAWSFVSWSILFPSSRVEIVALLIWVWSHPSRAATSGRVLTAAYCKEPTSARRLWRSVSVTGAVGINFLSLGIWIGLMSLTYCSWFTQMDWSFFWEICKPVKVKSRLFLLPNGYFLSSSAILAWKRGEPQHNPSSTWIPKIPSGWWFLSRNTKQHGSKGADSKPRLSRLCLSSWNQRNGASTRPYAPFKSWTISLGFNRIFTLISSGGSIPSVLVCCSVPRRNAVLMSKLWISHPRLAACCKIKTRDNFDIVGLSLGIWSTSGSSKPKTTSRAFARFWLDLGLLGCSVASSGAFHVRIQRQRRMFSFGIWCLMIFTTVSVDNQLSTSLFLASVKSLFSSWLSVESLTSLLCRLAADIKNAISEGLVSSFQWSMSRWLTFTSKRNTCSVCKWKMG